jgi:hypothetical protein
LEVSQNIQYSLPYDVAFLLLDIYSKKGMFRAALFVIAKKSGNKSTFIHRGADISIVVYP